MKNLISLLASTMIVLALIVVLAPANLVLAQQFNFTTLAGLESGLGSSDGVKSAARFASPPGVAMDNVGNVYVADRDNNTIRMITPGGEVSTLAGLAGSSGSADGPGTAARFFQPSDVALDVTGNVFVADTSNHTIRKITPDRVVSTLAGLAGNPGSTDGTGSAARFFGPAGVAVDSAGNVYVADSGNHTIREITPAGVVTKLAGPGRVVGSDDGTGKAARFTGPSGLAADSAGNVYVADTYNSTIRKITPGGVVSTLAGLAGYYGSDDGTGSAARFNNPHGVAVDSAGNVYVADNVNHTIRKITPAGVVSTLAGLAGNPGSENGPGSAARFNRCSGLGVDSSGNIYVADTVNNTIRKITPPGVVSTLAGSVGNPGSADGEGNAAQFTNPRDVAVDSAGNVYVADTFNHTVRKITSGGAVSTVAGLPGSMGSADGMGSAARFTNPRGVAVDGAGNVYVADTGNFTIRKITPSGVVSTLAGSPSDPGSADGEVNAARFSGLTDVTLDSVGNVYVTDTGNNTIRKITPGAVVSTLAGTAGIIGSVDGTGSDARFSNPTDVTVDSARNVYVADTWSHIIRKITPGGVVSTLAGLAGSSGSADGTGSAARFNNPRGVTADSAGHVYVADNFNQTIRKITPDGVVSTLGGLAGSSGKTDATGSAARFNYPAGVAVDNAGNVAVADTGNNMIRKITPSGVVSTLAGLAGGFGNDDGTSSVARFSYPAGLAVDSAGNVYVAETGNQTIRKVTPSGVVSTLAGLTQGGGDEGLAEGGYADGPGKAARFNYPNGVAVDGAGNVYVADTSNHAIRKVTSAGVVTTLAGLALESGSADGIGRDARFSFPWGVAVDSAGNIYVTDSGNSAIRKITPIGMVSTLAGGFGRPSGVAVDSADNLYVAESNTIRKITADGAVSTLAGLAGSCGRDDGPGSAARFGRYYCNGLGCGCGGYGPAGVAVDNAGNVYVADTPNSTIRKITPAGVVTTLAGLTSDDETGFRQSDSDNGTGSDASFFYPSSVAVDSAGNVYVADTGNHKIRLGKAVLITQPAFAPNTSLRLSGGQFQVEVTASVNQLVLIQATSALPATDWITIQTVTLWNGRMMFTDSDASSFPIRFYRAVSPVP